jgi:S1-C subfamily serine protease
MRSRKSDNRRIVLSALIVVLALVVGACGGSGGDSVDAETTLVTAPANDAVKSLQDVRGAVIRIEAEGTFDYPGEGTQYNQGSSGSGFFISPDGIAVTNNHVVTGAAFLQVYVEGEDEPRNAKILGVSECSDLAVIDVDGDGFPYLAWYPDELAVGVDVYAAGFPLGDHEYTLLDGIVSKEDADGESSWASVDSVIEHTADILPGNSGGPLVSEDGLVVGVNYAGDSEGQAFAIGREEAGKVLPTLQNGQDVTSIGINGSALVTDEGSGIWVYSIASGSPADLVGVRGGDIVSEIEGLIPATDGTMSDYCDVLRSQDPGAAIQIEVWRDADGSYLEGTLNTAKTLAPVGGSTVVGSTPETTVPSDGGGEALVVGECINDDELQNFMDGSSFLVTSCDSPHDNEVYYIHEYPEGPYPGDEAFDADLFDVCLSAFEPYVGHDFETSILDYFYTWPYEESWNLGIREGECFLFEVDGNPLTGSAYQSGW